MIKFKMCENYIQYVDGMRDCDRHNLELRRLVNGCVYNLYSVQYPELDLSYRYNRIGLFLPGFNKENDRFRLYFNKDDKATIIKFFDVYKDMLQLEGVDRWIL